MVDEEVVDLPPRRAWSSSLSVAGLASCQSLGMQPVGLVKGYTVMQWAWYGGTPFLSGRMGMGGTGGWASPGPSGRQPYQQLWQCPHGFVGPEHRSYGCNFEQGWVETNWWNGFGTAYRRLLEEAIALGAHGVIGVVDDMHHLAGSGAAEFSFMGTAVVVPGAARPSTPFTTYLAGQRLAKLIEAGYLPVAIVGALSSIQMYGSCITHYQLEGSTGMTWGVSGVGSIDQVGAAQQAARHLAREHIRSQLAGDMLHGATFEQTDNEIGESSFAIQCLIKGTRVHRFDDVGAFEPPEPVVRLTT
jgi:hypothetical protein